MYFFIYKIGIFLYGFVAKILALFQPKAKKWVEGRQDLLHRLQQDLQSNNIKKQQLIWFHCSSLGEFEQGRPLIESIKKQYPDEKILLTFFSPSGYEVRKNYASADIITYLPLDTKKNAKRFIDLIEPKLVFWVKYEFWYHFLEALQQRQIPTFLVSGIFRANHFFFSPFGKTHRQCLYFFEHLFVQNTISKKHLETINITHSTIAGDTRLDRVLAIAAEKKRFEIIEQFTKVNTKPIVICGSTWQPDEAIIAQYINAYSDDLPYRFIIAPHEIKTLKIKVLQEKINRKSIKYSEAKSDNISNIDILIIDNIGMLSALYRYGKIAYIGGAFGSGLHNTLEPIVFGLPVIFGTKYQKFEEAVNLVKEKGGFSIRDYEDFKAIIQQLSNESFYQQASAKAKQYVIDNQGATPLILQSPQVQSLLG
ncbi:MAG: 3-deoxy-D-manno-octulosonic acid transferase [Saprospiraceae bacterium]